MTRSVELRGISATAEFVSMLQVGLLSLYLCR